MKKISDLAKIVHNFTNGKKNFNLMLGGQKCIFDKGSIVYKLFIKIKYLKNYFVKGSSSNNSKFVCNYCNQNRHTSFYVLLRRMHPLVSNMFRCQKPQKLTLKDSKLYGYQKSMFELCL